MVLIRFKEKTFVKFFDCLKTDLLFCSEFFFIEGINTKYLSHKWISAN